MVVNVVYLPKVYTHHYHHGMIVILTTQGSKPKFSKQKVWGKSNRIYETYNNTVMPHGHNIYSKASDMAKAKICSYPKSDHALPH